MYRIVLLNIQYLITVAERCWIYSKWKVEIAAVESSALLSSVCILSVWALTLQWTKKCKNIDVSKNLKGLYYQNYGNQKGSVKDGILRKKNQNKQFLILFS